MSNIGSTALAQSKENIQRKPEGILPRTARQNAFNRGTMDMLDEARRVAESAIGEGEQLDPQIYTMLGLKPITTDRSGELSSAQAAYNDATAQLTQAKSSLSALQGIPPRKRTKQQKKQLKQLKNNMANLQTAASQAEEAFGRIQTQPYTITGFERLDPSQIPAESPFSSQNPLNKAQATEAQRLNEYLAGGEVDPTLKNKWDTAESSLRAKLSQRFGPDYEATSVGQSALQNFTRSKNEAFATYNQEQVEKYNALAFQGQANLQNLLANRIGLMREPSINSLNEAAGMSNLTGARIAETGTENQWALGHGGVSATGTNFAPAGMIGSALNNLLTTQISNPSGTESHTAPGWAAQGAQSVYNSAGNALRNWLAGAGQSAGAAAAANAANSGVSGVLAADAGTEAGLGSLAGLG